MTQSYLRFARYVTSLPASAAMTSRRCSSNYGNSRLTRHGSTFAIRRVASSLPKTYHPPQPTHPPDVVDLLQGRWPGHFIYAKAALPKGTPTPTAVQPSSSARARHRQPPRIGRRRPRGRRRRLRRAGRLRVQLRGARDGVQQARAHPLLKARTNADLRIAGAAVDRWSGSSDCHLNMKPDACNSA